MSFVNLTMEGFLAKDPDIKVSSTGRPIAKFSVAHNPGKKEENKPAIWFNFTAVGHAGNTLKDAKKGDKVKIAKTMPEEWTDNSGNKRLSWTVFEAELESREPKPPAPPEAETAYDDSDIPFN